MSTSHAMGWLLDWPDHRDFSQNTKPVKSMLKSVGVGDPAKLSLPDSVDLREYCSEIEDQESLGSCTAQAGVGLVEFFERKAFGRHLDASRLFLYKVTRNLLGWTGDTGAFLRDTMKAMVLFGVPAEAYWQYDVAEFEREPGAFCYAFARNYQAIRYYRLDPWGTDSAKVLRRIKANLSFSLPSMFGFSVYSSYRQADATGEIPYPTSGESIAGGHAVVAVGYDDDRLIQNTNDDSETSGALLIRNSWGKDWGDAGYGWLPYEYVLRRQAVDWWSLLKNEWIDTGRFEG